MDFYDPIGVEEEQLVSDAFDAVDSDSDSDSDFSDWPDASPLSPDADLDGEGLSDRDFDEDFDDDYDDGDDPGGLEIEAVYNDDGGVVDDDEFSDFDPADLDLDDDDDDDDDLADAGLPPYYHSRRFQPDRQPFAQAQGHRDRSPQARPADPLESLHSLVREVRENHARILERMSRIRETAHRAFGEASSRNQRLLDDFGRMVERQRQFVNSRARDELVAVEVQPARPRTRARATPAPAGGAAEVIDLTGVPDSPEEPRAAAAAAAPPRARRRNSPQDVGRNPRRHASSQNRPAPSLSRSVLGNNATFIDLTGDDSPPPPPPPPPPIRPSNHRRSVHDLALPNPRRAAPRAQHINLEEEEDEFGAQVLGLFPRNIGSAFDLMHRFGGVFGRQPQEVEMHFFGTNGAVVDIDPLGDNRPDLDYRGNGRASDRDPKPAHVPPPPPREGFTRSTGTDRDDDAIVCPNCEKELQYDPGVEETTSPRPAKRARSRKDQEEHHFWALKECGHVCVFFFLPFVPPACLVFLFYLLAANLLFACRSIAKTASNTASPQRTYRRVSAAAKRPGASSSAPSKIARLRLVARAIGSASSSELWSITRRFGTVPWVSGRVGRTGGSRCIGWVCGKRDASHHEREGLPLDKAAHGHRAERTRRIWLISISGMCALGCLVTRYQRGVRNGARLR